RAHALTGDLDGAAIAGSDLTLNDVAAFWRDLLPILAQGRGDWSRLHDRARELRARFSVEELHRLERGLERCVWLLRERARAVEAELPYSSFRFHLMLHDALLDGREAFEAWLADPSGLTARVARSTEADQLWVLALVRYDQMLVHIRGFRWHVG